MIHKIYKVNFWPGSKIINSLLVSFTKSSVTFYTVNKRSPEYVRFFPSINKDGGNQYTYTFWFNKKKNNYKNKTLFYRGNIEGTINKPSPSVGFGNNSDELVIDFQTNKEGEILNKKSMIKNKLFDITDHDTWYMITIIFKDYKADFLKRAEGDVHFVCNQGKEISNLSSEQFWHDHGT